MLFRDYRVTTWASKIGVIDYDDIINLSQFDGEYEIVCLSPQGRVLLQSLLSFNEPYLNRWLNFPSVRVRDQLLAQTEWELTCPVACQDDIQAINTTLQGISLTLIEMRDRLGGTGGDIDQRLTDINTAVGTLNTTMAGLGLPSILDQLEPMLNGVGVILGAPDIPPP